MPDSRTGLFYVDSSTTTANTTTIVSIKGHVREL